ncbi:hypothetical protein ENSA5_04210 [Enhygromyxa salina]|uniref:Uncharacterized protein n=1 Tax=Enhygromyxa salina TaxID=215803 RepID=A0A2S9YJ88_9BACT|nr:putative DNA-binding domain-containing protein [Enhygromyxa salina]PRQ05177.1 hypothetical protein ENSA5_04210 [Enhygromyxa salina]
MSGDPRSGPDPRVVQSALGQVIRDAAIRDRVAEDPDAGLGALGLDPDSRAGMLGAGVERLLAYHEMVHARLYRTIKTFIGGAAARLGEDRLHAEVRRFIADPGPTTVYLRDIPAEFLAWARPRWDADPSLPGWLGELAAHQVLIRTLRNDPREVAPLNEHKIDIERPIACNATVRVLRPRFAVHHLPKQLGPDTAPDPIPAGHAVIAYRHADDQPRFVDIKPRSAHLLDLLLAGKTLREALFGACEATGETLDDQILSVTALTLADLVERHILLGGTSEAT